MADSGKIVDFESLLDEVTGEYFDLTERADDSDNEDSDWTSACANDRNIELDFSDEEGCESSSDFEKQTHSMMVTWPNKLILLLLIPMVELLGIIRVRQLPIQSSQLQAFLRMGSQKDRAC